MAYRFADQCGKQPGQFIRFVVDAVQRCGQPQCPLAGITQILFHGKAGLFFIRFEFFIGHGRDAPFLVGIGPSRLSAHFIGR